MHIPFIAISLKNDLFPTQDTVLALFGIRSTKHLADYQKRVLLTAFKDNPYPTKQDKINLAEELGLNYKQIEQWYWNRRHKVSKDKKWGPRQSSIDFKIYMSEPKIRKLRNWFYLFPLCETFYRWQLLPIPHGHIFHPIQSTNSASSRFTAMPLSFPKVHDLLGSSDLLERFGIRCNWSPSKEQVEVLRSAFAVNQYPNRTEKEQLANNLNITLRNVDNWFRARRESLKKSSR